MAKILGIQERAGSAGLRSRSVQGIGYYEDAGAAAMRQRSSYDVRGFGQSPVPYDLGAPGAVAEVKRLLQALGNYWSDVNLNPGDTQTERTFSHIDLSPGQEDAWGGPAADALALTVGRHKDRFPALMPPGRQSPLIQLPKFRDIHGNDVIVGGPQPTVAGLEALAQAAHEVLKDSIQLDRYLAWRGGVLDCVGTDPLNCTPPDALVTPSKHLGKPWDPRGWTIAWRGGPNATPELLGTLDLVEQSLETAWALAPHETDEPSRQARANAIAELRQQRHDIVTQLNQGVPLPECKDSAAIYDRATGKCKPRCTPDKRWDEGQQACVIDILPAQYKNHAECMKEQRLVATEEEAQDACDVMFPGTTTKTAVVVGMLAALGVGGYFLFRDKKIPAMPVPK